MTHLQDTEDYLPQQEEELVPARKFEAERGRGRRVRRERESSKVETQANGSRLRQRRKLVLHGQEVERSDYDGPRKQALGFGASSCMQGECPTQFIAELAVENTLQSPRFFAFHPEFAQGP